MHKSGDVTISAEINCSLPRIVNRFSKDMDEVDIMIPTHIKDILNSLFSVLGTVFVICYASPIIIVFIVPMIGIFLFIQWSYLSASRQLKRMVSVTRSPINSSLTETFSGAATIRAFNMQVLRGTNASPYTVPYRATASPWMNHFSPTSLPLVMHMSCFIGTL